MQFVYKVKGYASSLIDDLFLPERSANHPRLATAWLIFLYTGGIVLWNQFYQGGSFNFNFHDWSDLAIPRLLFLKNALARGLLPLHISGLPALGNVTDRYLAVPNTLISPQALLLGILSAGEFVFTNTILMYSLGFLGLLWFRRRFSLSPLAFAILFILFNFNGHILAHLSVGHESWSAYFLYAPFAALVLKLLDGDHSWAWIGKTSGLLLFMFMQGAFHQFIWLLLFLGLIGASSWRSIPTILKASTFAGLLSLFRLLPPALLTTRFEDSYAFMGGYPTVTDLLQSLFILKPPGTYVNPPYSIAVTGYWEFDLYIGLIGVAFIAFFGIYRWIKNHKEGMQYYELVIPMLILLVFSLGSVFKVLHDSPIPFFKGERVSARMVIIPFIFLLIVATIGFQRWLDEHRLNFVAQGGLLIILGGEVHDLWEHFTLWSIANVAPTFNVNSLAYTAWFTHNHVDIPYTRALELGLAGSAFAAIALMAFMVGERRAARAGRQRHFEVYDPDTWVGGDERIIESKAIQASPKEEDER